MKRYLAFVISFVLLVCVSLPAYAHAGSTDEYGGHVDWSSKEYHYHHGYPAHSHDGGYCPYEFVDNADHSNNGYSGSNNYDYNYGDRKPYLPDEQYPLVTEKDFETIYDEDNSNNNLRNFIEESTVYENTSDELIANLIEYFGPIVFVFGIIVIQVYAIDSWSNFNEKKQHYTEMYGGKDILDIINAPPTAFIDSDGYPHLSVGNDDIFVVYVAPKQPRVFHRNRKCGKNLVKRNYIDISSSLNPCKKCKPVIPDTSWYDEYLKIKAIKDKYKID